MFFSALSTIFMYKYCFVFIKMRAAQVLVNRADELVLCLDKIFERVGTDELRVYAKKIFIEPNGRRRTVKMFTDDDLPLDILIVYSKNYFRIALLRGIYIDPTSNEQTKFQIHLKNKNFATNLNVAVIQNYTIVARRAQNFVTIKREDVQLRF